MSKIIISAGLVICFVAVLAKGSTNDSLNSNLQEQMSNKSDSELINDLYSPRGALAGDEIVRRGVRMIPLLLNLKGDERTSYASVGHHLSATATTVATNPIDIESGRVLTMEVTGIYLICAIYHNTVEFAQSPYLTDLKLPAGKRKARNTPDLVARAWQSVEEWNRRLEATTIRKLRSRKDDPLKGSGLAFW
ncbi:MAG TPA: hypothetical protein VK868_00155 [Pyrinomonadaceae bacterium]|nr:hypothetical protein [Pyrinomonadaceae bacterium]